MSDLVETRKTAGHFVEPDTSSAIGAFRKAWLGYSNDSEVSKNAASGGIVSQTLIHLLETKQIDAALVCGTHFKNGRLEHDIFLAKTKTEILNAQTSKYFDIPMLKGMKLIKDFDGKVAVVGIPSQINPIARKAATSPEFAEKIKFKISVFCGHNSKEELIRRVWTKHGIREEDISRFYYRKGLWRGQMLIELNNGETKRLRFQEFSHYQNLHILSLDRCLNCFDHMGYYADLSTGDVWLHKMRDEKIKHSVFMARTEVAERVVEEMIAAGKLTAEQTDRRTVYLSQKRSINYHYNITARARLAKIFGLNIKERITTKVTLRDYLGAAIVLTNHKISKSPRALSLFMKLPRPILAAYLYIFKGLMHYERKEY